MSDRTTGYGSEQLLRWFEFDHLPVVLQETSKPFWELAHKMHRELKPGAERTTALRKLLESKDAAVRAAIESREDNDD